MSDFLDYWDTRIDANERFFNNYPHIANFAFSECQKLWDRMEEKNKALLTRHNALVEAVKEYMKADDAWYESAMSRDHDEEHIRGIAATAARAEVDKLLEAV